MDFVWFLILLFAADLKASIDKFQAAAVKFDAEVQKVNGDSR